MVSSLAALCAVLAAIACGSEDAAPASSGTGGSAGRGGDGGGAGTGGSGAGGTGAATGGTGGTGAADAGTDAAIPDDPDPVITPEARTALEGLRYLGGAPPADPSNRVADDPAARAFGQLLFFDPSLSGRLLEPDNDGNSATLGRMGEAGKVSCAGCHVPQTGFVDTRSPHRQISLAAEWGRRRAPTLLEIAFLPLYNWDGRSDSLWTQAIGVMENVTEFNSGRLFVAQQIFRLHRARYEAIFGAMPALDDSARFPQLQPLTAGCEGTSAACRGKPGDGAEYDGLSADGKTAVTTVTVNAAKAMAAYLRQLRCGPGKFDAWLGGDANALGRSEQRGAALFVGSAGCVRCHSGPTLSDGKFHNVGLRPATVAVAFTDTGDRGAGEGIPLALADPLNSKGAYSDGDRGVLPAAGSPELEGAFRTPTLRCIAIQPSFMHTGQIRTLDVVVRFFSRGGDASGYPGTNELAPLNLSDREQADVVAFLRALQGPGPEAALLSAPRSLLFSFKYH
jgi:cytochrome c peroxidase